MTSPHPQFRFQTKKNNFEQILDAVYLDPRSGAALAEVQVLRRRWHPTG